MKTIVRLCALLILFSVQAMANDLEGVWTGTLRIAPDREITAIYRISRNDAGDWTATHDSPDQFACGIPVTAISLEGDQVELSILNLGSRFQGSLNSDRNQIAGTFQQRNTALDLVLTKSTSTESQITRAASESTAPDSIEGDWYGVLDMGPGQTLNLIYHISRDASGNWVSTQDSPEQFMCGYPVTETRFDQGMLALHIAASNFRFSGQLSADGQTITGEMSQHGLKLPLNLGRHNPKSRPLSRPQHPQAPFPYQIEQVVFENTQEKIKLAGTLTRPDGPGPYPAVVLVSGSGAHDRDQTIFGHKPFWVIADYLARNGIAVLRYDERGVGQSQGVFHTATTVDLSRDVEAAVKFLSAQPGIDTHKTGIIGHSEGGIIGPMVARRSDAVDFLVLMAAPADTGLNLILKQQADIARVSGQPEALLQLTQEVTSDLARISRQHEELDTVRAKYEKSLKRKLASLDESTRALVGDEQAFIDGNLAWATDWFRYFLAYDPTPALSNLEIATLAINGDRDLQVDADINLGIMKTANSRIQTRPLSGLNHLFQHSNTGALEEYGELEQTIAPEVLKLITEWIGKL